MRKIRFLFIILIIAGVLGGVGYRIWLNVQAKQAIAAVIPVQTVMVAQVSEVKKQDALDLYSTIEPLNTVAVNPKVSARITRMLVDTGDTVKKGQVIADLDDQDYQVMVRTSQNTLDKAQLNYDNLKKDYDRYQQLFAAGAMTQSDLDKAKLGLDVAAKDLDSAKAGLTNAQQTLDNTVLRAPISGVVVNRSVSAGQLVSPAVNIAALADISQVYATVNVKQEDIDKIKAGSTAEVIVGNDEQHPYQGEIALISPMANPAARVFQVKVKLDNKDNNLKPGMFADVRIPLGEAAEVLAVPMEAVSGIEGAYFVYLADGDTAVRQPVEIGSQFDGKMEIKSGLKQGDKVIITNVNKLNDQDKIAVAGGQ